MDVDRVGTGGPKAVGGPVFKHEGIDDDTKVAASILHIRVRYITSGVIGIAIRRTDDNGVHTGRCQGVGIALIESDWVGL